MRQAAHRLPVEAGYGQAAAAHVAVRFAVGDMHEYLVRGPAVGRGAILPHGARELRQRGDQFFVGRAVGFDFLQALCMVHDVSSLGEMADTKQETLAGRGSLEFQ
jgi:hypothetical protein